MSTHIENTTFYTLRYENFLAYDNGFPFDPHVILSLIPLATFLFPVLVHIKGQRISSLIVLFFLVALLVVQIPSLHGPFADQGYDNDHYVLHDVNFICLALLSAVPFLALITGILALLQGGNTTNQEQLTFSQMGTMGYRTGVVSCLLGLGSFALRLFAPIIHTFPAGASDTYTNLWTSSNGFPHDPSVFLPIFLFFCFGVVTILHSRTTNIAWTGGVLMITAILTTELPIAPGNIPRVSAPGDQLFQAPWLWVASFLLGIAVILALITSVETLTQLWQLASTSGASPHHHVLETT